MSMNTVCELNKCAGCMACTTICPKEAISIQDSLSEYNAVIDSDKCVDCNACHKVCQYNRKPVFRKPLLWKQGWAQDKTIRDHASSGGVASSIELSYIKNGGVVYSCSFINGDFRFIRVDNEAELIKLQGSKYVKSNPDGVYKAIKSDLQKERRVLFLGLPCQVAAVLNICGEHECLTTIDLICHGSPSPKLLELFLKDHRLSISDISSIEFRTKSKFQLKPDQVALSSPRITDYYTMLFLNGTTYTENCYSCGYARTERVSDITLGDSWGSELPIEEQKKGISLLLIQTEKGAQLVENSNLELFDVDSDKAAANNHQLNHPSVKNSNRAKFFAEIKKGKTFTKATITCFPTQHFKNRIKKVLISLRVMGGVNHSVDYGITVTKKS